MADSAVDLSSDLGAPELNDAGQVLFVNERLTNNSDNALVFGSIDQGLMQIARRHEPTPAGGTFGQRRGHTMNAQGRTAFIADVNDGPTDRGLFLTTDQGLTQVAYEGQPFTGIVQDGTLGSAGIYGISLGGLQLSNDGSATFTTGTSHEGSGNRRGIFRASEHGLTQLASEYQEVSNVQNDFGVQATINWGNLTSLGRAPSYHANNAGQIIFNARHSFSGTSVHLFRASNGVVTEVLATGDSIPGGGGEQFGGFTRTWLNDQGGITFSSVPRDSDGNSTGTRAYFHMQDGQTTELVRQGQEAPDGNGFINSMTSRGVHHNDVGAVAFYGTLTDVEGATGQGIFRASADGLVQIARQGGDAPGGGVYSSFNHAGETIDMNDAGVVAFRPSVDDGGHFTTRTIFLGDGIDTLKVVRGGSVIEGLTVNNLNTNVPQVGELNNHGQLAYRVTMNGGDEAVILYTPDLHYRVSDDGSFDDGMNWTLSLTPGEPHDVFIDSDSDVTVTADAGERNVNSLEIGGGAGQAALHLVQNSTINVAEQVTIKTGGTLGGEGSITGDVVNLGGLVSPGSSPGILSITGDYTQDEDGTLLIEIGGLDAGIDYDVLDIAGDAVLGGELVLRFIDGFAPSEGNDFDFVQVLGDTFENFELITIENLEDDFEYDIVGVGSLVALNDATFIPEPGTLALLSMGGLMLMRRRNRA